MMEKRIAVLIFVLALTLASVARAAGMLVPTEPNLPPLAIQSHRIQVDITDQVARVHVIQTFKNSINRDLEATYVFPVPGGAAISDFILYINGKPVKGEVLDAKKAQSIYEDIVRRARDPGLLEFYGNGLLRMRVFPVPANGVQKVELKYNHTLRLDEGVCHFRFPLKTGQKASQVLETLSCMVNLKSRLPISTVYSPSHKISVSRNGDREATAGYEVERAMLDTDFDLYWSLDAKDIGMGLITHRLKTKDGHFIMMLAPKSDLAELKVMPKDVCFVLDTSGSMEGEKMTRAKEALSHCLKALKPEDRFKIVKFSTAVEPQSKGLLDASNENVSAALEFVKNIEARGGTDIDGALTEALQTKNDAGRLYLIVFLTDGKPTVGRTTETEEIIANVKKLNSGNARIFTFGIDEEINVKLLDRITECSRGYSEYVKPNEEIEVKVSNFFAKAGSPVLTGLELEFPEKLGVTDVYPRQLPDLFRGMQLIVMGRYRGAGDFAVRLKGKVDAEAKEFIYEGSFPESDETRDFIPGLWALRKIGYLMDQIRLHGEKEELVQEVVRLSREYNIVTPYTSSLVLEDAEAYRRFGLDRDAVGKGGADAASYPVPHLNETARFFREPASKAAEEAQRWTMSNLESKSDFAPGAAGQRAGGGAPRYAAKESGGESISSSNMVRQMASNEQVEMKRALEGRANNIANRRFIQVGSNFVDDQYRKAMPEVRVRWGSEAYFQLARNNREIQASFTQGRNVTMVLNNQAIIVSEDDGKEQFTEKELKAILGI